MTELPEFPLRRDPGFDPAPQYRRFRLDQPLVRASLRHGQQAWLVTRFADVRTVLQDPRFSSDPASPGFPQLRPVVDTEIKPGIFLSMDPPQHGRYRRMLAGEFTVRRMARLQQEVDKIVEEHFQALLAGPRPVDLVEAFAMPIPAQVICGLLGVPYADRPFFSSRSRAHLDRSLTAEQVKAALDELGQYLDELVAAKEAEPGDDLISRVAVQQVHTGELTHEELVGFALLLLVGGHETTANTISLAVFALLSQPDQWAALCADPGLVDDAVDELLRYLSPVHHGVVRAVTGDIELSGQLVRAGEGVIAVLASANRDAAVYPDADRIDVHRDARDHLAFGSGAHHCIGQQLARLELQAALRALVGRLPGLRLAVPPEEVAFRYDSPIYGLHSLPLTW